MKNFIAFWSLLAVMAFGFCGCSDDDEGVGSASDIVGSWIWVSTNGWIKEDGKIIEEWEDNEGDEWLYHIFYEDGRAEIVDISDDWQVCEEGTWKIKNGEIHLTLDGEYSVWPIISLTSTEMVVGIHEKEKEDGVTYEYYESATYKKVE